MLSINTTLLLFATLCTLVGAWHIDDDCWRPHPGFISETTLLWVTVCLAFVAILNAPPAALGHLIGLASLIITSLLRLLLAGLELATTICAILLRWSDTVLLALANALARLLAHNHNRDHRHRAPVSTPNDNLAVLDKVLRAKDRELDGRSLDIVGLKIELARARGQSDEVARLEKELDAAWARYDEMWPENKK
ncbi:hypothetical protein BDV96DRAFT_150776 [Lophiotrema nucula]|uniref:Uncharacterized protein n=1 Tax=Lophiotrema nucula TaxID=690887 RepID=A0A6A5Z1Y5_9PLEO|nr:hypothetical protein BDV96DRAFT_150776 [Lophiotrema nucula]